MSLVECIIETHTTYQCCIIINFYKKNYLAFICTETIYQHYIKYICLTNNSYRCSFSCIITTKVTSIAYESQACSGLPQKSGNSFKSRTRHTSTQFNILSLNKNHNFQWDDWRTEIGTQELGSFKNLKSKGRFSSLYGMWFFLLYNRTEERTLYSWEMVKYNTVELRVTRC